MYLSIVVNPPAYPEIDRLDRTLNSDEGNIPCRVVLRFDR